MASALLLQYVFLLTFLYNIHQQGWSVNMPDENTIVMRRPHFGYPNHPDFSVKKMTDYWQESEYL